MWETVSLLYSYLQQCQAFQLSHIVSITDEYLGELLFSVMNEVSGTVHFTSTKQEPKPVDQFHMTEYLLPHVLNV